MKCVVFFCQAPFFVSGVSVAVEERRWQTYFKKGGALHSPHNPVTWIYDAVIYGNASLIERGGLLKVPGNSFE